MFTYFKYFLFQYLEVLMSLSDFSPIPSAGSIKDSTFFILLSQSLSKIKPSIPVSPSHGNRGLVLLLNLPEHLVRDECRCPERTLADVPRDDTDVGLTGIERECRLGDTLLDVRHDVRRIVEERAPE